MLVYQRVYSHIFSKTTGCMSTTCDEWALQSPRPWSIPAKGSCPCSSGWLCSLGWFKGNSTGFSSANNGCSWFWSPSIGGFFVIFPFNFILNVLEDAKLRPVPKNAKITSCAGKAPTKFYTGGRFSVSFAFTAYGLRGIWIPSNENWSCKTSFRSPAYTNID